MSDYQTKISTEEIDLMMGSKLSKATPFAIYHVSHTQLSIARYYGGIKFMGETYTYFSDGDILVRDDVVKFILKVRNKDKKNENFKKKEVQTLIDFND